MSKKPMGEAPLTPAERQERVRQKRRDSGDKQVLLTLARGVSLAGLDEDGKFCAMDRKVFLRYTESLAQTLSEEELYLAFYADLAAYAKRQISRWHSYKAAQRKGGRPRKSGKDEGKG